MPNEAKPKADIRRLCAEGMLFEVQALIQAGGLDLGRFAGDRHPLPIAAGRGFHSLVLVLLPLSGQAGVLDAALRAAARGGHLETVRLLLAHGASAGSVPPADAVRSPNPEVPALLAGRGLDLVAGHPLARALVGSSEEALALF